MKKINENENRKVFLITLLISAFLSCTNQIETSESEIEAVDTTSTSSNQSIWAIFEDSRGNFWFGSNIGVCRYDGESLTHYLEDNPVRTIQEDRYGNIWFVGGAISSYDGEKFTIHVIDSSQGGLSQRIKTKNEHTSDIKENEWRKDTNDLWFEWGNGVYRYDGQNFIHLPFPIPNDDDHSSKLRGGIMEIFQGKKNLWISGNTAVVGYDGKVFTFIPAKRLSVHVRAIFEDSHGNLWIGSNWAGGYCGLMLYDGDSLTHFSEQKEIINNDFLKGKLTVPPGSLARIFAIAEDNAGNMWFGTIHSGVWRFDGKSFINYTLKDGLTGMVVTEIYKDKKGDLWFGMGNGTICIFNGRGFDKMY